MLLNWLESKQRFSQPGSFRQRWRSFLKVQNNDSPMVRPDGSRLLETELEVIDAETISPQKYIRQISHIDETSLGKEETRREST